MGGATAASLSSAPEIRHRRAPPPPPCSRRWSPSPAALRSAGADKRHRSRGAPSRPSYADDQANKQRPGVIFVRRRRWWDRCHHDHARINLVSALRAQRRRRDRKPDSRAVPGPLRILRCAAPGYAMKKRKAERRQTLCNNLRALRHGTAPTFILPRLRGRAWEGALACRRSTTALAAATERHRSASATRLPGTWSARAPRWFERRARRNACGPDGPDRSRHRGRYPRLPVPVQRDCTRSPVMMPAGRVLPKPPGSTGDEPMPAGTAPAPPAGVAG